MAYAELRASSSFSFLDSSALPEDLAYHAATNDLPAMALIDSNGVYGAPRFYTAAKKAGIKAIIGAEVRLEPPRQLHEAGTEKEQNLTLLVESREGYKNLCKLLTAGALNKPKGEARCTWEQVEAHANGLHCITRADEATIDKIAGVFKNRTHVELQRHRRRDEEHPHEHERDREDEHGPQRPPEQLLAPDERGTPRQLRRCGQCAHDGASTVSRSASSR